MAVVAVKLQDVCDELTHAQQKVRQMQQDHVVWSARERALSARSSTRPASVAQRSISRASVSSVTSSHMEEEDEDRKSQLSKIPSRSGSPYHYSDNGQAGLTLRVQTVQKAYTLPDAEMYEASKRFIYDEAGIDSYSSITNSRAQARKLCSRSKSAMDARNHPDSYPRQLSRQCCDVLGAKVCRDCALLKRRMFDRVRNEVPLLRLEVSERNYADSMTLQRNLPDMPPGEIEDKVISGEILRVPFRQRLMLKRERTILENKRSMHENPKKPVKKTSKWNGVSSTFFTNIRDLNNKIIIGKLTNKLCNFTNPSPDYWIPNKETGLVPMSPRPYTASPSVQGIKARYSFPFEPPLIPRHCQSLEPKFFAGCDGGYKLPDRLPDKVFENQIDDFSELEPSWSRGSSRKHSENME